MVETEKNKKVLEKEMVKPIVDKTKEKPKVVKAKLIAKETKWKPANKTNKKSSKPDKDSYLHATTNADKFLDDETRKKIKEYYRQDEMQVFGNINYELKFHKQYAYFLKIQKL